MNTWFYDKESEAYILKCTCSTLLLAHSNIKHNEPLSKIRGDF